MALIAELEVQCDGLGCRLSSIEQAKIASCITTIQALSQISGQLCSLPRPRLIWMTPRLCWVSMHSQRKDMPSPAHRLPRWVHSSKSGESIKVVATIDSLIKDLEKELTEADADYETRCRTPPRSV